MDWYTYTYKRGEIERELIRPMTARQAQQLGAEPVPDFDPAQRVAGVLVISFPPEGELEELCPVTAEAPAGRFA